MPAIWGGAIAAGGSLLGGLFGKSGANKAAASSEKAAQMQQQMYLQTRADLSPYNTAGQQVLPALNALAMSGPTGGGPDYVDLAYKNYLPPQMTQAQLEQTPGYQFTRDQGLKAVQSANAARGLGVSGAAMKGAASFATGLANNTYKDQFNVAQQRFADVASLSPLQQDQLSKQYQRLHDTAALGENAAAGTGTAGTALAGQAGNALQAAGTAEAAGTAGIGKSLSGGVQNALGYYQFQQYLNKLPNQTGGTSDMTAPAGGANLGLSPNFQQN